MLLFTFPFAHIGLHNNMDISEQYKHYLNLDQITPTEEGAYITANANQFISTAFQQDISKIRSKTKSLLTNMNINNVCVLQFLSKA